MAVISPLTSTRFSAASIGMRNALRIDTKGSNPGIPKTNYERRRTPWNLRTSWSLRTRTTPFAELSYRPSSSETTRVAFELKEGQSRMFHTLPSGMKMEVITHIHNEEEGTKEKKKKRKKYPLVFIHGSYHAAWCWAVHWLPFFASHGYDCYALSLLGQGESDIPSGASAGTLQTHARDVAHFIGHNLSTTPVLVGHSIGGLIVQYYLSNMSKSFLMDDINEGYWKEPYPALAAAILLCSVPPTGTGKDVWRFLLKKPIAAFKVTLSLAAKAFASNLSLCRETFFSKDMSVKQVESFQALLKNSSSVPVFDLRKLNASLPIGALPEYLPPVLVAGAGNDFILSDEAIKETAEYFKVSPVVLFGAAHDVMLDTCWERGAQMMLSWLDCTQSM